MNDWVKRQRWGKNVSILRCAYMDIAALTAVRRGEHERAAAQLIQNVKAKLQMALTGGDWTQAWLLTGLEDPISAPVFAGDEDEMAAVAGYTAGMAELTKRLTKIKKDDAEVPQ